MQLLRVIDLNFVPLTFGFCHTTATPTIFVGGYESFFVRRAKLSWHGLQRGDTFLELDNQEDEVIFICPSPFEEVVLFGSGFGIRCLDLKTREITNPLPDFEVKVTSCTAHAHRNLFLAGGYEQLWQIDLEMKQAIPLSYHSSDPALSPFHPFIETFFYTCSVESLGSSYVVFQGINGGEINVEKCIGVPIQYMSAGGFHPKGTHYALLTDLVRVFTYPEHQQVCAFDATGEFFHSSWEEFLKSDTQSRDDDGWRMNPNGVPWGGMAFSRSGEEIYCATPTGRILHVNWVEQQFLGSTVAHEKEACKIAMSKDGKYLASIGRLDQTLKLWQLSD